MEAKEMNKESKSIIRRYWILPLIFIKGLFYGFTQVIWGIAGIFLLAGLVAYFDQEIPDFIFIINGVILDRIMLLIILFAIIFFYFEFLELRKLNSLK